MAESSKSEKPLLLEADNTDVGKLKNVFKVISSLGGFFMKKFNVKVLVFSAVALALALVTSFVKIIDLPSGGAVTLLSMFFVCIIGYWYGPYIGIISAVVYGLLQFVVNPYFLTILQVFCDYIFAFGSLGLAGLFHKKKFGLQIGYLVGVFGRFVFSVLSGVIFFAEYAEGTGHGPFIYSVLYNGAYLGLEAAITLVVIFLPPVQRALAYVKKMALS